MLSELFQDITRILNTLPDDATEVTIPIEYLNVISTYVIDQRAEIDRLQEVIDWRVFGYRAKEVADLTRRHAMVMHFLDLAFSDPVNVFHHLHECRSRLDAETGHVIQLSEQDQEADADDSLS